MEQAVADFVKTVKNDTETTARARNATGCLVNEEEIDLGAEMGKKYAETYRKLSGQFDGFENKYAYELKKLGQA